MDSNCSKAPFLRSRAARKVSPPGRLSSPGETLHPKVAGRPDSRQRPRFPLESAGPRPTGFGTAGSGTQGPLPPRVQSRTSCQARPPSARGTSPGARPLVPVSGPSSSRGSSEASKYRALFTPGAADPESPPPPPPRPGPRGTQGQLPPPPGPTPGSFLRGAPASPRLRPELPAHSALTPYAPPTRPTPQTYSKTCSEVQIFIVPAACSVSGRR